MVLADRYTRLHDPQCNLHSASFVLLMYDVRTSSATFGLDVRYFGFAIVSFRSQKPKECLHQLLQIYLAYKICSKGRTIIGSIGSLNVGRGCS